MDTVRFYFSFRSPYSWLSFYRMNRVIPRLPLEFEFIPCFPPKEFDADPRANPAKGEYITADVARFAEAYGLPLRWPRPFDTDWVRPHAAFVYAQDQGLGREFGLATHAARFSEGRDIGTDDAIGNIASSCGLNPAATVRAAGERAIHKRVLKGMEQSREDGLFGVPFFVYRGQSFMGNDRIEWLLRTIHRDLGKLLPDMQDDPFARPYL
ncbi:MAG: DsbA family protein [Gammaproteobacteria bacterium]|nr:DsbA family protein [Gammaproteobacteria bacterium]